MENKDTENEVLAKISEVAKRLEKIQPASYTDNDLDNINESIRDLREEVEQLEDNYHKLDKQLVTFLDKLNDLEKEINSFEENEGVSEDKARAIVTTVVSSLITGIAAYIFGQIKPW